MKTPAMRKSLLLFAAILPAYCATLAQPTLGKITKSYFRSDPFTGDFSSFLRHLINDPSLTNKSLHKKTDTSLFSFGGTYATHNPFFFKPKRVEVLLSETEVKLKDTLAFDTIYVYQLFAFNDGTERGTKEVKREFDKIVRRYKGEFYKNVMSESPTAGEPWTTCNFFSPYHGIAPFSVTWIGPDANKEVFLLLTIRMDNSNNSAVLPIPF
jgi:hypothetical protein